MKYFKVELCGKLYLKKTVDLEETSVTLLKKEFSSNQKSLFKGLHEKLIPHGLPEERQWYLYDQIRMHIPDANDKEATCPKPSVDKPKKRVI